MTEIDNYLFWFMMFHDSPTVFFKVPLIIEPKPRTEEVTLAQNITCEKISKDKIRWWTND